jgi:hypothetical protein
MKSRLNRLFLLGSLLLFRLPVLADDRVMEIITLQNRPAAEIQPALTPLLDATDVVSASGFDLIVKTTPERLESILALIQQLDKRQHNLLISVIQNSHKTADELNAEASVMISSNKIRMQGMLADTRDISQQHSTQQLRTLEGRAAHIQTGQQRPIEQTTVYDSGYGYPGVSTTTQMQEASSGFAATPRLLGNNDVIIDIAPWSDRFVNSQGLETQSVQTSLRTKLGEWVELAGSGLNQQSDSNGLNGMNYQTNTRDVHILLKVELVD